MYGSGAQQLCSHFHNIDMHQQNACCKLSVMHGGMVCLKFVHVVVQKVTCPIGEQLHVLHALRGSLRQAAVTWVSITPGTRIVQMCHRCLCRTFFQRRPTEKGNRQHIVWLAETQADATMSLGYSTRCCYVLCCYCGWHVADAVTAGAAYRYTVACNLHVLLRIRALPVSLDAVGVPACITGDAESSAEEAAMREQRIKWQ